MKNRGGGEGVQKSESYVDVTCVWPLCQNTNPIPKAKMVGEQVPSESGASFHTAPFLFSFPPKVCQSSSEVNRFIPTRIIGGEIRKEVKYKFRPPSAPSSPFGVSSACPTVRCFYINTKRRRVIPYLDLVLI